VLRVIVSVIVIFKTIFFHMAFPVKQVRTLEEQQRIIEEVEKNLSQKRTDVVKRLGLAPSTLNSIIAMKREIREQADKCGTSTNKRMMGKELTYRKMENIQARASGIPVDGTILQEETLKIAAAVGIENASVLNGWISRLKQRHSMVFKKLPKESSALDTIATDPWFERLPELLEGYEAQDIYNADETGFFSTACHTERWH
jgi:hypothetical protein